VRYLQVAMKRVLGQLRPNHIPRLLVRHKGRVALHISGLCFLAAWEPLSFPLQLQKEVGSHLGPRSDPFHMC